jgi:hypothetical protein
MRSLRNPRVWLFPILTLLIAGSITILSRSRATAEREAVRVFVEQFVGGGPVGATQPFLVDIVLGKLPRGRTLLVDIRDGDGGPAPDGAASHVAIVRADGLAALGLRCRYDADPAAMAVVGVFEPGHAPVGGPDQAPAPASSTSSR